MPVADRFHLLKDLVEAVQQALGREQAALRAAAQAVTGAPTTMRSTTRSRRTTAPRERARAEALARRPARYDAARRLHAAGKTTREMVTELRMGPNAVRRSLRAPSCPEFAAPPARRSRLTPFEPYLRERWNAGEPNGRRLLAAIRARGYRGSSSDRYTLLALWRVGPRRPGPYARQGTPAPAPPPAIRAAPRGVSWRLLREEALRSPLEQAYSAELRSRNPVMAQMSSAARASFALVHEPRAPDLEPWPHDATASGLPELLAVAEGVRRDLSAVRAAMTLPWSQGQTEGQVNRLKLLKRQ